MKELISNDEDKETPIVERIDGYCNKLLETVTVLEKINEYLSGLDFSIKIHTGQTKYPIQLYEFPRQSLNTEYLHGVNEHMLAPFREEEEANSKSHTDIAHNISDGLDGISKFCKGTKGVIDLFDEIPEHLNTFKKGIGIVSELSESTAGIIGASAAMESAGSIAGGFAATGEILSGAASIAETCAAFGGPAGVAAGVAILAGGAMVAMVKNNSESERSEHKGFLPDKRYEVYLDEERKKDRNRLMVYHRPKDYRRLYEIEQEPDSDYMVSDRIKRVEHQLEQTKVYSPDLAYRHRQLLHPEPFSTVSIQDNKTHAFPHLQKGRAESVQLAQKAKEIRYLALFDSMDGKVDTVKLNKQLEELYKKNKPPAPQKVTYRLPTEREWEAYEREQMGLPKIPERNKSGRGDFNQGSNSYTSTPKAAPSARTINIHLNKPMIENFIVHTKDIKEGTDELRRKVEDVLIKILNGANAIQ